MAAQRTIQRALLASGAFAPLVYIGADIIAAVRYPGYSYADQAVSELFAIGAPTSALVVALFSLSSALMIAFAFGVRSSSAGNRALRAMAWMIVANAIDALLLWNFFPMHMRKGHAHLHRHDARHSRRQSVRAAHPPARHRSVPRPISLVFRSDDRDAARARAAQRRLRAGGCSRTSRRRGSESWSAPRNTRISSGMRCSRSSCSHS